MNFNKIAAITLTGAVLTSTGATLAQTTYEGDEFMGYASTGEAVVVTSISGYFYGDYSEYRDFTYTIGNDYIEGTALCAGGGTKWIAEGYGEYEAQSEATLNMVRFVCEYEGELQ